MSAPPNTFCDITNNFLTEALEGGRLVFKSPEGRTYEASARDSMVRGDDFSAVRDVSRFENTLQETAFDIVNPRIVGPCEQCGRRLVSYQRIGEAKHLFYACRCGHQWRCS